MFDSVDFVLDIYRPFIGAHGIFGAEIIVYWVENKEYWYNHLCCNPWVTEPDYQLVIDAYESGWDDTDTNSYVHQPPGTGLWPPAGLNTWVKEVGNAMFVGNGFLDNNDGHTGYEYTLLAAFLPDAYFPEQYDFDRDSDVTCDCRTDEWEKTEQCTDLCDTEDPVLWHGPGQIMVEINLLLCDTLCGRVGSVWSISGSYETPYFTIGATDVYFCGGESSIDYDTILVTTGEITIVLDTELDFTEWKSTCDYNLILVGGPAVNIIVKQLVDEGISTVDWETSLGEWEYIKAPYSSCDVLIVAGADRDATRAAVQVLIDGL